jgi:hypothetical protein
MKVFLMFFLLYESFITFLIFFFSEYFIDTKGLVKFSKSVISRSNSLQILLGRFPIIDYIKTQAILYFVDYKPIQ